MSNSSNLEPESVNYRAIQTLARTPPPSKTLPGIPLDDAFDLLAIGYWPGLAPRLAFYDSGSEIGSGIRILAIVRNKPFGRSANFMHFLKNGTWLLNTIVTHF